MTHYYNPYSNKKFFEFFSVFFGRLLEFVRGNIGIDDIASDEVQLLVLSSMALSTALVGSFLVLRRMTMLANSLSHTILIGIVIVFLFTQDIERVNIQAMLGAAIITGLLTAYLTQFLTKTVNLQADASTGIVFTTLFALGIILVTLLTKNAHIGTEIVMGNADALHITDFKLVALILLLNLFLFTLFFKQYKITTFDPALAKSLGFSVLFFDYLLMSQVSVTAIGAFRAVGVLMVLAFITGPPLTARLLTDSLKKMLLISMGLGLFVSLIGVALTRSILSEYGIALTTGGVTVCVIGLLYTIVLCVQSYWFYFGFKGLS